MVEASTLHTCANCQATVDPAFRFCPICGQEQIEADYSLKGVFKGFLGDYFTFDSKIAVSIKPLLFKPGFLTREYALGRRVRYITPLRLYIFISILFFLMLNWGRERPTLSAESLSDVDINPLFEVYMPRVFFLLLPLFAAIVGLAFRKNKPGYLYHLIFALHYHAFVFFVLIIYLIISRITATAGLYQFNAGLLTLLAIWFICYLLFAMRRAYGMSWGKSIVRFILVSLSYSIAVLGVLFTILAMLILRN